MVKPEIDILRFELEFYVATMPPLILITVVLVKTTAMIWLLNKSRRVGQPVGRGLSLQADLINDNVDINDNLAAPLLVKAPLARLMVYGLWMND